LLRPLGLHRGAAPRRLGRPKRCSSLRQCPLGAFDAPPRGGFAGSCSFQPSLRRRRQASQLGEVAPLVPELRELILRKCAPSGLEPVRAIIERQSFGELERLVAQTLLHVAHLGGDVLHMTPKQRARLDAVIASWEWDPATFALTLALATGERKRFEYSERLNGGQEKGLLEFLRDPSLSGTATDRELAFLKSLLFTDRRPTALYYYRELQNLRDPLHFRA